MRTAFPHSTFLALLGAVCLLVPACGDPQPPDPETAAPPAAVNTPGAARPAPSGAPPADPGFGMVSSRGQQVGAEPMAEGSSAHGLAFELPDSWRQEAPSSSMRMAQAAIPGPGGEGQLAAFFFGAGGGGGVEANIQRWLGQVQADPGAEPRREQFVAGPLTVHYVEVAGTLLPSQMGMGPTTPQPGQRLFGAVVEGPGGPWFFKVTGPAATLEAQRDAFLEMLRGLRPAA